MSEIGIKELAETLGVSTASVSRALSNPNRVSKAMREKVQAAAKKVGYRPNMLGSGLRTSKTGNIIVIIPDISDTFNFGVIRSLEKVAAEHGYSVLLGDTQGVRDREIAYGEMIRSKQADGIISFSHRLPFEESLIESEDFIYPPIVNSCEPIGTDDVPLVSIDNRLAAKEATQHLLDLGHRNIAVITGDVESPSSKMRLAGYRDALSEAGITYDDEIVKLGTYTLEAGESYTKDILLMKERPSAIFCFCDETALGCLSVLKEHNFAVPKDISVVGFDDIRFARYFSPSLTTIAQPVDKIGRVCFELLLDIMNGNSKKPNNIVLPHKLIVRNSTGTPSI